jgi:chromosome segregation ATPase
MLNFLNKRKREIERLNNIIDDLQGNIKQYDAAFYNMNARKIELERELKEANNTIVGLKNEVNYLKMRIENTKGEVNSRYY